MRSTYTYAVLEVSTLAYEEIRNALKDAGYDHAFHEDGGRIVIDMHGVALAYRCLKDGSDGEASETLRPPLLPHAFFNQSGNSWCCFMYAKGRHPTGDPRRFCGQTRDAHSPDPCCGLGFTHEHNGSGVSVRIDP